MPNLKELTKIEADCKYALGTAPGQRILRYLIMLGSVYNPVTKADLAALPVKGPGEGLAYLEGRRSLVLQLMRLSGLTQTQGAITHAD